MVRLLIPVSGAITGVGVATAVLLAATQLYRLGWQVEQQTDQTWFGLDFVVAYSIERFGINENRNRLGGFESPWMRFRLAVLPSNDSQ